METILHYDRSQNQFWFPFSGKEIPGNPFAMRRRDTSYDVTFSGRYPMSIIGLRAFKALHPNGRATPEALTVIERTKKIPEDIANEKHLKNLKHLFKVQPYAHQRDAIENMLHCERLALLLEQGLGKTYISIMAIMCFRALGIPHKTLVVCPSIVFNSWLTEIGKYSDLKVLPYRGLPDTRKVQRKVIREQEWGIVLTTFDQLTDHAKPVSKSKNQMPLEALKELWSSMSTEDRGRCVSRWSEILPESECWTLITPKKTAEWINTCARILKQVPLSALPVTELRQARAEVSNAEFFRNLDFDNLIIDEASRCISHESKHSQFLDNLSVNCKRVYLLSGTLCVGRPTDMFMPMHILDPNIIGGDWYKFKKTYCRTALTNRNIIIGYRNVDKLKTIIAPHILNKERSECIDLPDRIMMRRYYDLPADLVRLYNKIVENDNVTVAGREISTKHVLVKIVKCLQVLSGFLYVEPKENPCNNCDDLLTCVENGITPSSKKCVHGGNVSAFKPETISLGSNPKLALLEEDLEDNGDAKTIIWAWYQHDLSAIEGMLKKKKISYITADTEGCAEKFEADSKIRVFLGQTVQGIGITLNSASTTIYYSHGTALEPRLQSMDRNYRIGQTKSVLVKDYLCAGTIEESIVALLSHKQDVKTFMQKNISCISCSHCPRCTAEKIQYLRKGCIHENEKLAAESRKTLKMWSI